MSPEPPTNPPNDNNQLFTVPIDEFLTDYRPLTTEEMAKLGVTLPDDPTLPDDLIAHHNAFLQDIFISWDKNTTDTISLA